MKAALPPNEDERIKALNRYNILDSDAEREFDDLTLLASQICGTPIALISLVDNNRQWFKSKVGLLAGQISLDLSFCAHGILQVELFVVPDAQADARFASNPLVTGEMRIRFYAGSPLVTPDGHALGMLCVIDLVARELSAEQKTALEALSRQVVALLELRKMATDLRETVAALKQTQAELDFSHAKLLEASRLAGMAEIASSVLHNVGNVLNSINVSCNIIAGQLKKSKAYNIGKAAALMEEHAADLGDYLTNDPKGRQIPNFLKHLGEKLAHENTSILDEVKSLSKNVDHVKDIIAAQQSYAKVSGVTETVHITDLIEDALKMNATMLARHDVQVFREYIEPLPLITVDKHKVLQILVNLIRNAKQACDEMDSQDKRLTMRVTKGGDRVRISLTDNGIGIPAENLSLVFNHGFTTKEQGHGFGLHSGALAAREMGGSLSAHSEGPRRGATFTLALPCDALKPHPAIHPKERAYDPAKP